MVDIINSDKKIRESDIRAVNIVGSGDLDIEIDLAAVTEDLLTSNEQIKSVEHSRRRGNRLNIRFAEWDTLGILAPTGVTTVTGASCYKELFDSNRDMINSLVNIGLLERPVDDGFGVRNLVFVGDYERQIDLDTLAISIGLEHVEYEPEQFSGLVYRPQSIDCTILVFATGKTIITGVKNLHTAVKGYDCLNKKLKELL